MLITSAAAPAPAPAKPCRLPYILTCYHVLIYSIAAASRAQRSVPGAENMQINLIANRAGGAIVCKSWAVIHHLNVRKLDTNLCRELGADLVSREGASVVLVGKEGDDFLGGGIPVDQVLLQGAQILQGALIYGSVDAAGQLHMRIQPSQLLPGTPPSHMSELYS